MKGKGMGIVYLVIAAMSIFGAYINGTYARMAAGIETADIVTLLIQACLIILGLLRLFGSKKSKE